MRAPLLIDLSHTSHTRARTGIQRVARGIYRAFADRAVAITHDPYANAWRELQSWEQSNLAAAEAATKRGAKWPLMARWRGRLRRWTTGSGRNELRHAGGGLIVPEVFSATVGANLPALFGSVDGPRVAVFHDAIALKLPELTPAKTVARFPAYLRELLAFDGIAANSDDSREALVDYWRWLGVAEIPAVCAIPLGLDFQASAGNAVARPGSATSPVVLSIGSIEGRKNHVALLDACEQLWARGVSFELHLIGLAQAETGAAALSRIRALQGAGRHLRYDGAADDTAVTAAYARCTFTVYPSLLEGFGLPVLESLAHGKPCITSSNGALGESARGGGALALNNIDPATLAAAIEELLTKPTEVARLSAEARARKFRTWSDYAADLTAWLESLPSRRTVR